MTITPKIYPKRLVPILGFVPIIIGTTSGGADDENFCANYNRHKCQSFSDNWHRFCLYFSRVRRILCQCANLLFLLRRGEEKKGVKYIYRRELNARVARVCVRVRVRVHARTRVREGTANTPHRPRRVMNTAEVMNIGGGRYCQPPSLAALRAKYQKLFAL